MKIIKFQLYYMWWRAVVWWLARWASDLEVGVSSLWRRVMLGGGEGNLAMD